MIFSYHLRYPLKIAKKLKLATKESMSLIGQVCNFRIEDAIDYGVNHAEIIVDENLKKFKKLSTQFETASEAKQQKILQAMKSILDEA